MASKETVGKLLQLAEEITRSPIDQLVVNKDKWGSINFETARKDLELIHSLCNHFKQLPLEWLPESTGTTFVSSFDQCRQAVETMRSFSVERSNPIAERDNISSTVHNTAEQLLVQTQGWIAFLAYQKGDVQQNIEGLAKAVGQANGMVDAAKSEIGSKAKEIDEIIRAAREASATVGVGHFTSDFSGHASTLEGQAKTWLRVTGGLGVASLAAAALSFFAMPLPDGASTAKVVQYMTSKLVFLGVLVTATIWCGRIYKATKHQATVNLHRANALKTFQAFVKAASEDSTRDAVLLETTRSIFALTPSGYLDATESTPDAGGKVVEVVKAVASAGGGARAAT